MGSHAAPSWEVTLLRRPAAGRRPRVAGKVVVEAPDADSARAAAQAELEVRANGESRWWSLGVLRPLTPKAPGTHPYAVVFAEWESNDERFVRRDVHEVTIWAADAADARRLAQQEIQSEMAYRSSWRIRAVSRADARPGKKR
jgi:hypothetical protein